MTEATTPATPVRRSGKSSAFTLLAGVAAGLLIAALSIPGGTTRSTTLSSGDDQVGVGDPGSFDDLDGLAGDDAVGGPDGSATGSGGSTSGGRRATGGTSGSTPGASGGGGGGGGGGAAGTARGVSDDKIRIGVAIPDIGAFAVVDEFNLGDMRGHMEAILDGWKRDGLVPVHGRDVEFVYRTFNIVGDEEIAACNGFVKDDRVFMVIGIRSFEGGSECLADRFDTPVVTLDEQAESTYSRLHPYLFTLRASAERVGRNFVRWAHDNGHLAGKTIGIYEEADAAPLVVAVRQQLEAYGYEVAAHATTRSKSGGPDDQVAMQRFRSANVDLGMLFVAALSATSFMEQAESQGYRPTYLATDHGDHTSDAGSSTFPEAQYGGTLAMTLSRAGEVRAGGRLTPQAEACVSNYERYSGRSIDRSSPESAELVVMLQECDEAAIVLAALQNAGRALDRFSFVAGAEAIQSLAGNSHGAYRLGPTKHHGAEQQRTIQWLADCACWTAVNDFGPLWTG